MTDLTPPEDTDLSGAWGIIRILQRVIALFTLFLVPNFTVADYLNATTQPNFSNDAGVSRW